MPATKPKKKASGSHNNPRFLMSGTEEELEAWERTATAAGTNRVAWLRGLANAAAKPELAWKAARLADVLAVSDEIHGRPVVDGPTQNPRAVTPARLESLLAKRSGFPGWKVKFHGTEFEAKPPPMPKDWKP